MSFDRYSAPSEGSASKHSTISVGSTRSRPQRGPATVHAASLLSLQLWAISELRNVLPPLGDGVRAARLLFLGIVAALAAALVLSYPLGAFVRWVGSLCGAASGYTPTCSIGPADLPMPPALTTTVRVQETELQHYCLYQVVCIRYAVLHFTFYVLQHC